nr:hypothetical protein [Polyangiaceae bacterium]
MNAPTWDLTSYFPSFRGEAHTTFSASVDHDARALLDRAKALPDLSAASVEAWTQWIQTWEELSGRVGHLGSFVGCLNAAHAEEESYQVEEGRLAIIRSTVEKATSELKRALAHSKDGEFAELLDRKEVAGGTFVLAQLRDEAQTRMSTELEALASDLAPDGLLGWGRLYDQVSGGLSFEMEYPDGKKERTPMAKRRSLMSDADRRVRSSAFRTGNAAWESVGPIVASSLNHLAGTRHVLNERRGIKHIHDVALRDAAISKKTLSAMMEDVFAKRPLIQTA